MKDRNDGLFHVAFAIIDDGIDNNLILVMKILKRVLHSINWNTKECGACAQL